MTDGESVFAISIPSALASGSLLPHLRLERRIRSRSSSCPSQFFARISPNSTSDRGGSRSCATEYVIESRGEGILRFEVTPNSCAVAVESPWAGAGLRADFPVHFFTGTKRAYAFRVPKDAKEISVERMRMVL